MTLSFNKLNSLFLSKNLVPKTCYTISNTCVFVETFHSLTGQRYMFYIPSKYEISSIGIPTKTFKIKYLDIEPDNIVGDTFTKYTEKMYNQDISEKYGNMDITSKENSSNDMEEHLNNQYKNPIEIKEIDKLDNRELRSIFRQLRRLRLCMEKLKYKVVIMYKSYLCVLRVDNDLECYYIKNYPFGNVKQIYVMTNIEEFYNNIATIENDLTQVNSGVKRVLDQNHLNHTSNLNNLITKKSQLINVLQKIYNKKLQIRAKIDTLHKTLTSTIQKEKNIFEEHNFLLKQSKQISIQKSGNLAEIINRKQKLTHSMEELQEIKKEIVDNINSLIRIEDNISLTIDQVLFDNTVMLDTIFNNLSELEKL